MSKYIRMYCGSGKGKTSAAIGRGVQCACEGKSVFVVSFLKGSSCVELSVLKRLEPEIKIFSFEKFRDGYSSLTEEEKAEERLHVQTGLNFARKVLVTEECDVLILDEILDLSANGIIRTEDIIPLLESTGENMELILTGEDRCEKLWPYVNLVTEVSTLLESADD